MANIYPTAYLRDEFMDFKDANLSIASSAVLYGLSTYSVMPVFKQAKTGQLALFRYPDHFKRLQNSAKILGFSDFLETVSESKLKAIILELLKRNKVRSDTLVRMTIFVDGLLPGAKMVGIPHKLAIFAYEMTPIMPLEGAKLMVSSWRRTSDNAIPARAKVNGSYVNSALMKNEALIQGFDDAVALDDHGHVTESSVSNLFFIRKGQLITPSAASDLLEGITRNTVFELAKDLNIESCEQIIDRTELYIADEAFLSGSSVSITPVINIDGRVISNGQPGVITKKLMAAYDKVGHGASPDKHHWLS